jgi:hypothetical protein
MSTITKSFAMIMIAAVLLSACSAVSAASPTPLPAQGDNPYSPQPADAGMMESKIEIVSASVVVAESMPPQISVSLAYRLATPCSDLRVSISQPDRADRIQLQVYGVAPKDKPCTLMALSTPQQARISLGSFPAGSYTVWVNGVQVGDF